MATCAFPALVVVAAALGACTAEQAYITGQAWQRNQCAAMPDKTDYERCLRNADMTYESYRRETGATQ